MTALHDAVSRAARSVCDAAIQATMDGDEIPQALFDAIDHLSNMVEREARGIEGGGTA